MGNRPRKYLHTRNKLQWFFEQVSSGELHSLPLEYCGNTDLRKRQGATFGRLNDIARIRWVLNRMLSEDGLPIGGKRLRLTQRMMDHVVVEFTDRKEAIEKLYGACSDPKRKRYKGDIYRQTLNIALARVEAAFFGVKIFTNRQNNHSQSDVERNALGYLRPRKHCK